MSEKPFRYTRLFAPDKPNSYVIFSEWPDAKTAIRTVHGDPIPHERLDRHISTPIIVMPPPQR